MREVAAIGECVDQVVHVRGAPPSKKKPGTKPGL